MNTNLEKLDSLKSTKKTFYIHSKNLFLTYKKTSKLNSKSTVKQNLLQLFFPKKANIIFMVVSFETSDNDHPYEHFHVYIELDRNVKIYSEKDLDIDGIHGNYQAVRNKKECLDYVIKDKNYVIHGYNHKLMTKTKFNKQTLAQFMYHHVISLFVAKRKSKPDFTQLLIKTIDILQTEDKILYFLHEKQIRNLICKLIKHNKPEIFYEKPFELNTFKTNDQISNWKQIHKNTKTLVLIGPSGIGKTELCKALFNKPLLVSHIDQLKELQIGINDVVILDDMVFNHWLREDVIHLTDLANDRGINVKGDYVTLPAKLPRIITSNKELQQIFPKDERGAILRRIFVVRLTTEVFTNEN